MKIKSVVPMYDLEAPGLERSRISTSSLVLLIPVLMVLLALVAFLILYQLLSKKPVSSHLERMNDLRISFRKMR